MTQWRILMKKKLLKEAVMFITGRRPQIQIKGESQKAKALLRVMVASKNLYEALESKNPKLKEIERLVEVKKIRAIQFKKITGNDWPL